MTTQTSTAEIAKLHTEMESLWSAALAGETEGMIGINAVGTALLGKSACFGESETARYVDIGLPATRVRTANTSMIGSLGMRVQVWSHHYSVIDRVFSYFPNSAFSSEQFSEVSDIYYLEHSERGARRGLPQDATEWLSFLRHKGYGQLEIRLRRPDDTPLAVATEDELSLLGPYHMPIHRVDEQFTLQAVSLFLRR